MSVALARVAVGEGALAVVMESLLALLAELTLVALGAVAPLDPVGGHAGAAELGRLELDLVEEANALRNVCPTHSDSGDVGQDGHEVLGSQARAPAELWVLVEPEGVLLHLGKDKHISEQVSEEGLRILFLTS